jgi:transcriptional regulator with XRE-family HTH domain
MLDCLGAACRDARTDAGVKQLDVATRAGTSHASISRFENGRSWPRIPLDTLLSASLCGRTRSPAWQAV